MSVMRQRREMNCGRFAYGSFRLRSVRLRLESIRLRLICQFAYVLKHVLQQLIHLLYVRSRSDPSRSIQFLRDNKKNYIPVLIIELAGTGTGVSSVQ